MALAESFRAQLITLARNGEAFDRDIGLPESLVRKQLDVSFLAHAREFMAVAWNVTWRLNSGVPPTDVAAWAGHSVEVLMRVYAKCMTGLEDVWIGRMEEALHLQDERPGDPRRDGDPR